MSQSASVYFVVGDADGLYAWHRANGVEIVEPPRDQPYRLREFTVRDLDGYYLNFGHRLSGGASQLRHIGRMAQPNTPLQPTGGGQTGVE